MIFSLVLFAQRCINPLWQAIKRSLRQWTKPDNYTLALNAVLDMTRSKSQLVLENALLRQQLSVLQQQIRRPKLSWRDRTLIVLLASKLRTWKQALVIVQPDTVLRWHRDLFRRIWKRKTKSDKKPGRPPLADKVVALIKQMAEENRTWGAKRIRGELLKLGLRVSKSAIQKYIQEVCKSPPPKQNWSTFLRNHASQIWACEFLQTYDILFRTVFVFVIIRKYGPSFDRVVAGIEVLKTPYKAPKANATCERFLGSLRREWLNHFLILGEKHLYRVVKGYTQYFNRARPHQGIEQRIPCRPERLKTPPLNATLASQPVLSGLHHDYYWQAAQPVGQRSQPQAFLH